MNCFQLCFRNALNMSSKRKLVGEVVSGGDFFNNMFGDAVDEQSGKLELGPTMLDITKALKYVTEGNNNDDAVNLKKYTIMLCISRGAINNAFQFFEIESKMLQEEILDIFLSILNISFLAVVD